MSRRVRLDTHKVLHVLWGLFRRGPELELQSNPDYPDLVFVTWPGLHGGTGTLWLDRDDAQNLATLRRIRHDPSMGVRAKAIVAVARELHGKEGEWQLERVAELLHGPRNQRRSRARHLPAIHELMALFERGRFELAGLVDEQRKVKPKKPDRRAEYGAVASGPLLRLTRLNARSATVELNTALRDALGRGPYTSVPDEAFRLTIPGHHNPHGNRATRAGRARCRIAAHEYGRFRENAARKKAGALQPVAFETFLGDWAGLDAEQLRATGRLGRWLDDVEQDLMALGAAGDVGLVEPVERERTAGRCLLRLVTPAATKPAGTPVAGGPPHRLPQPRRLAGVTATGRPTSTGPPPRPPFSTPSTSANRG